VHAVSSLSHTLSLIYANVECGHTTVANAFIHSFIHLAHLPEPLRPST
jgi:hypothetical protein